MNNSTTVVAFDFDGTIVDTELAEFDAWRLVEATFGVNGLADRVRSAIVHGPQHDTDELSREVAIKAGVAAFQVESVYRRAVVKHPARRLVRPEALRLVRSSAEAGNRLVICSGARSGWVGLLLEENDLYGYFESEYARNIWEPNHQKSDAYEYLRTHFEAQGAVKFYAVEDSPRGIVAAYNGGWIPVFLPNALVTSDRLDTCHIPPDVIEEGQVFLKRNTT